jgi:hypothetical protein
MVQPEQGIAFHFMGVRRLPSSGIGRLFGSFHIEWGAPKAEAQKEKRRFIVGDGEERRSHGLFAERFSTSCAGQIWSPVVYFPLEF